MIKCMIYRHLMLAKALVKTTAGYLIHRTVEETNHLEEESPLYKAMHQGNKLATLTGDLLVISLIKNIADTKSNKVSVEHSYRLIYMIIIMIIMKSFYLTKCKYSLLRYLS
jgi:hypothetical protein